MIDLRLHANELIGKTIKKPHEGGKHFSYVSDIEYTYEIYDVYQHHVLARIELDTGETYTESFNTADLVMMGLIKTPQRALYHKNEEGGRDGYGWYR